MGTRINNENGSFVVVRVVEDDSDTSIWVGKVLSTILVQSGTESKLVASALLRYALCGTTFVWTKPATVLPQW